MDGGKWANQRRLGKDLHTGRGVPCGWAGRSRVLCLLLYGFGHPCGIRGQLTLHLGWGQGRFLLQDHMQAQHSSVCSLSQPPVFTHRLSHSCIHTNPASRVDTCTFSTQARVPWTQTNNLAMRWSRPDLLGQGPLQSERDAEGRLETWPHVLRALPSVCTPGDCTEQQAM